MAITQDFVHGQRYVDITEKLTGEDHTLRLQLSFDVPVARLMKQVAAEFQAGEGFTRIPTGPDVAPTGNTLKVGPITEAPRAWVLARTGPVNLDMGISLYENNVQEFEALELYAR